MSMWATKSNVFDGNASLEWIHSYPRAFLSLDWCSAWQELLEGGVCEFEAYSCMYGFGGGGLKNDLDSWQEGLERWSCEVETYSCMYGFGGEV